MIGHLGGALQRAAVLQISRDARGAKGVIAKARGILWREDGDSDRMEASHELRLSIDAARHDAAIRDDCRRRVFE